MRKSFLLSLLFAIFLPLGVSALEAYAVYTEEEVPVYSDDPSSDEHMYLCKLTFYCDDEKYNREGTVYDVQNYGEYPGWYTDHCHDIKYVEFDPSFQMARPRNTRYWFAAENQNLSQLVFIDGLEYLNTSLVTDMTGMFSGCSKLDGLDLSGFDTGNVVSMGYMFKNCENLYYELNISSFDTQNVKYMYGMFSGCRRLVELDLSSFDTRNVEVTASMFENCSRLECLDLSKWDTSSVTDMTYMFRGCGRMTTIYCGHKWTTENVEYSYNMFGNCRNLVGGQGTTYDEEHIDATYARADGGIEAPGYFTCKEAYAVYTDDGTLTFYYDTQRSSRLGTAYDLNTGSEAPGWYEDHFDDIIIAVFDESFAAARPSSTYSWFPGYIESGNGVWGVSSLTEIKDIQYLNTSEVTNMSCMFLGCGGLSSLDLSNFDTSKVTNMSGMFDGCSGLTSIDVSNFDTSKVTNMNGMFGDCASLTSLDVSNFDTSKVTEMVGMFSDCASLTSLDLSNFDTSEVTYMISMFQNCMKLTSLNLSNFDTSKVTEMNYMFFRCTSLTTIYCGNGWNTGNVNFSSRMFEDCNNLMGGMGTVYDPSHTDKAYAHVDGGPDNPGYFTLFRDAYAVFTDDGTLTFFYDAQKSTREGRTYELSEGIGFPKWDREVIEKAVFDESFKDARPIRTGAWFYGQSQLSQIEGIQYLNTSDVTFMGDMFSGCSSLTNLDLSGFITTNVTDMTQMFDGCSSLTNLDVRNFDTQHVESMINMFADCNSLTSLDLSSFDTHNVTLIWQMFYRCSNLTTIYCGDMWNMDNIRSGQSSFMFDGCTSLVGGKGTVYDPNHTDLAYAHADGGPEDPGYFTLKTLEPTPTGVDSVQMETEQAETVYDLQGRRVRGSAQKGIYIVNGRKVVR